MRLVAISKYFLVYIVFAYNLYNLANTAEVISYSNIVIVSSGLISGYISYRSLVLEYLPSLL